MFYNLFLFYFPSEILVVLIALRLLRIKYDFKKVPLVIFIHCLILLAIQYLGIPHLIGIFISIITAFGLIKVNLKANILQSVLITFLTYSIYIPLEVIIFSIGYYFQVDYFTVFNSLTKTIFITGLFCLLLYTIKEIFDRNHISLDSNKLRNNRALIWIISLITLENIVLIHYYFRRFISTGQSHSGIFLFGFAVFILSILSYTTIHFFKLLSDEIGFALARDELDNLSELNYILRKEKHDFIQHLQLLMSLLQLKKYDKAIDYMKNITDDIKHLNQNINTGIDALDGLLQYKITLAKKYNIKLNLNIMTRIKDLSLSDSQICRIMGNLIDNAIDYLSDKDNIERFVQLSISQDDDTYFISVTNPVIDKSSLKENIEKLLQPGYTTKGDGHGIGLSIINEIVIQSGGKVVPHLEDNLLTFKIITPKNSF